MPKRKPPHRALDARVLLTDEDQALLDYIEREAKLHDRSLSAQIRVMLRFAAAQEDRAKAGEH